MAALLQMRKKAETNNIYFSIIHTERCEASRDTLKMGLDHPGSEVVSYFLLPSAHPVGLY